VFAAGVNKWGQLGIGEFSDCSDFEKIVPLSNLQFQSAPHLPTIQTRIEKIECGLDHCLCSTNMGLLFEWGANHLGQLGNKRKANVENPLILNSLRDRKVIDLSCGQNSSAVVLHPLPPAEIERRNTETTLG